MSYNYRLLTITVSMPQAQSLVKINDKICCNHQICIYTPLTKLLQYKHKFHLNTHIHTVIVSITHVIIVNKQFYWLDYATIGRCNPAQEWQVIYIESACKLSPHEDRATFCYLKKCFYGVFVLTDQVGESSDRFSVACKRLKPSLHHFNTVCLVFA